MKMRDLPIGVCHPHKTYMGPFTPYESLADPEDHFEDEAWGPATNENPNVELAVKCSKVTISPLEGLKGVKFVSGYSR
jgi:hypothetical protein